VFARSLAANGRAGDIAVGLSTSGGSTNVLCGFEEANRRGMLTFATAGPNTRTTQVFFNFRDNSNLDHAGFTPFGRVVQGEEVLDKLYRGYGEGAPDGSGPDQARIQAEGNAYLRAQFPRLDSVKTARLVE